MARLSSAPYRKVTAMAGLADETRQGGRGPNGSARLGGASLFAGAVMMLSGPLSILMGASGIAADNLFAASLYAYRFDLTAWGWIHIIVGLALVIGGMGVVTNQSWGRGVGAAAAGISLITQFMFVPYYPLWALPMMVLDLLVIFALTRFHTDPEGGW